MAIWQFDFYIIPIENQTIEKDMEKIISWESVDVPDCQIDFLENRKSWSDSIMQYGAEDETCIKLFSDNGKIVNILCRLDLRALTKNLLDKILLYIQSIQGLIFYKESVFSPKFKVICSLLQESDAYRFCKNPVLFFEQQQKNNETVTDHTNGQHRLTIKS